MDREALESMGYVFCAVCDDNGIDEELAEDEGWHFLLGEGWLCPDCFELG